jgi:hypothetical protein
VLIAPVDPEQLGVLAADAQHEGLAVHDDLEVVVVIPPPSGSTTASTPGHRRSTTALGSTGRS